MHGQITDAKARFPHARAVPGRNVTPVPAPHPATAPAAEQRAAQDEQHRKNVSSRGELPSLSKIT